MKSEKFWNRLASGYDQHTLHTYRQTYIDTISKSQKYLNQDQIALDLGCGSGITTIELSKSVKEMFAIDTAEKMIDVAAAKIQGTNIKNIHFDVSDIFDACLKAGTFDVVMAYNILCYIKDMNSFLSRVFALLRPNGVFLSTTDCWGEKVNFITCTQSLLCKAGIVPFMENLEIHDMETSIQTNGFQILESCNLYDKLPNLFVAARKTN